MNNIAVITEKKTKLIIKETSKVNEASPVDFSFNTFSINHSFSNTHAYSCELLNCKIVNM